MKVVWKSAFSADGSYETPPGGLEARRGRRKRFWEDARGKKCQSGVIPPWTGK